MRGVATLELRAREPGNLVEAKRSIYFYSSDRLAMSLHDATLRAYKATCLDSIPLSYVEEAWETNFCETVPLPVDQEDSLLDVLAWRGVVENTREWAREEEGSRVEAQGLLSH